MTSAISDVKDALADLGIRTTVLYDYEVREHPHMLSWFKAIVVPRLAIARIGCEDYSLLNSLNRYVLGGGKLVITGEFDQRTSTLAYVNGGDGCSKDTNAALPSLPANILGAVPPGPDWQSQIQFTNDSPFPWRDQWVSIDTDLIHNSDDAWFHDPQLRLSPKLKAGANVLASYLPRGNPAIVGSAPLPGHALGNVIVIGPRLRFLSGDANNDGVSDWDDLHFMQNLSDNHVVWGENHGVGYDRYLDYDADGKIDAADVSMWSSFVGDSFNLTAFFRTIFKDWGLLPLEIDPNVKGVDNNVVIAHLGLDGLAIGNNTDSPNIFRLSLPFKTLPRDPADAQYFPSYPVPGNIIQADSSNSLDARRALFIALDVPVVGDVNQSGCVDLTDIKLITAQLQNPKPSNPAYDIDGDGKVTVLDARKAVLMCSLKLCASCK